MSFSTVTAAMVVFQQAHSNIYPRRLLLDTPVYQQSAATPPLSGNTHIASKSSGDDKFDANIIMILSVLLCALVCSLGLNSIIRCAFRRLRLAAFESSQSSAARLANTGIRQKALRTFPIVKYSADLDAECVICLSEFAPNERVKVLPKCNHGFHIKCIDRWLNSHSSCPTCRQCLIETCKKLAGSSMPIRSQPTQFQQESIIVKIAPLEPEGVVHSYET